MTELFSREQLLSGLKKAHAAQDTEAMQQLAAELQRMDDEGVVVTILHSLLPKLLQRKVFI